MQPDTYAEIANYGLQMMLVFAVGLLGWTVKVFRSQVDTMVWYRLNGLRIVMSIVLFWFVAAGLVLVPNFAAILGSFGFNADQSPAGIAIVVALMFISGSATEQAPLKVEVSAPDPIPNPPLHEMDDREG